MTQPEEQPAGEQRDQGNKNEEHDDETPHRRLLPWLIGWPASYPMPASASARQVVGNLQTRD
jgi:hypothetical protein